MEHSEIFTPFFAMMILTLIVWLYMYARRIAFLNSQSIEPDALTPARLAEISPPAVANPSDNLKNLFEMPVIFYALALYLYLTGETDVVYVAAAWTFVAFRVLHSAVHCTVNIVMLRFALYAVSSLALWFMVLRAAISYFS
ncbi:MAG: MAPEG family protein [Pseudomonadales bacterium]